MGLIIYESLRENGGVLVGQTDFWWIIIFSSFYQSKCNVDSESKVTMTSNENKIMNSCFYPE